MAQFVIVSHVRTGSTLLADLLDSHPGICCDLELFKGTRSPAYAQRLLNEKLQEHQNCTYGFMLKLGHIQDAKQRYSHKFLKTLHQQDWQLIYVWRRNVFAQAISLAYVLARGEKWHDKKTATHARPTQSIAIEDIMMRMRSMEYANIIHTRILRDLPHHPVVYEDDLRHVKQHQATADRIAAFLDLPSAPVTTKYAKSIPADMATVILNYEEIAAAVRETRYAHYLEN